jgi:hypothetical protein
MEWVHPRATRPVPQEVREDLLWWKKTLVSFELAKLIPKPDPTDIGWVGNASTSFVVGVLIGRKWAHFQAVEPLKSDIAWMETVAVRVGLLMLLQIGATPGRCFIFWTDNTRTQGVVHHWKSNHQTVNGE